MASTVPLDPQHGPGPDLVDTQVDASPNPLTSNQPQSPPPDRMFSLFPELPIELRVIVWEMALPGPRCLEVIEHRTETGPTAYQAMFGSYSTYWTATDKPPAMFFTCRESREIALNHYQSFKHGPPSENKRVTYIDPLRDTLFCTVLPPADIDANVIPIDPISFEGNQGIAKAIPNLARLAMDWENTSYYCFGVVPLRCFKELKEVLVVPESTRFRYGRPHERVFKDVDQETWNNREFEEGRLRLMDFTAVRQWDRNLREAEEQAKWEDEIWVAPTLRVGMFVEHEQDKPEPF